MLALVPARTHSSHAQSGQKECRYDRRAGVSDAEAASNLLLRATSYLLNEQLAGTRQPVLANREAINILCEAGRKIAQNERRQPLRRSILSKLRGSLYNPSPF